MSTTRGPIRLPRMPGADQIVTMLTASDTSVSTARNCGHRSVRTPANRPRHTYVSTGHRTSFGLTSRIRSSFSIGVSPASRHRTIETATVRISGYLQDWHSKWRHEDPHHHQQRQSYEHD
jgi:hypothetical protein